MTEQEWLECTDPQSLLQASWMEAHPLNRFRRRKLRLFTVACCWHIWPLLKDQESQTAVEVGERFADRKASKEELASARAAMLHRWGEGWPQRGHWMRGSRGSFAPHAAYCACRPEGEVAASAWDAALAALVARGCDADHIAATATREALRHPSPGTKTVAADAERVAEEARNKESAAQCDLLRDIFGNFFRPAGVNLDWRAWNAGIVVALARSIYDDRSFDHLPILADALEDAGCDDANILDHMRGPGPHTRGCWVLDLLLGKE